MRELENWRQFRLPPQKKVTRHFEGKPEPGFKLIALAGFVVEKFTGTDSWDQAHRCDLVVLVSILNTTLVRSRKELFAVT